MEASRWFYYPTNKRFFPRNQNQFVQPEIRDREPFKVNFTRTEAYRKSTIPTCQRLLNKYYMDHPARLGQEPEPGKGPREEGAREQGGRERPPGN